MEIITDTYPDKFIRVDLTNNNDSRPLEVLQSHSRIMVIDFATEN